MAVTAIAAIASIAPTVATASMMLGIKFKSEEITRMIVRIEIIDIIRNQKNS